MSVESAWFSTLTDRTQPNDLQMDVWWWLLLLLAQVSASHDVVVTLNTLRPVTQTSATFLGISTSPAQLLNDGPYSAATVNLLQALSPGYLRVGGHELENLSFKRFTNTSDGFLITESQWVNLNQLAAETGLHLVFSLSPKSQATDQLLSFSENRGYDITWQLGYCIAKTNGTTRASSNELAEEVINLRHLVDFYPRYRNTAVLGPDLELCEDPTCIQSLKDLFRQTNDATDVVVLKMTPQDDLNNFKSMFEKLDKISGEMVTTPFNRDILLRRNKIALNKNLWIAEAENVEHRGGLRDAMVCALFLGHTSLHGYDTFLLHLPQLSQPSPSYWTALLYRAMVGQAALGVRVWSQEANMTAFAACTVDKPHATIDTAWEYDAGAVTLWGVNSAEESTHLTLRTGSRLDYMHLYILTQDDRDKGNILLNGQPLRMVHGVLPRISPRIRMISRSMSVTVPGHCVFFIVLPNFQAPACLINPGGQHPDSLPTINMMSPVVINIPTSTSKSLSLSGKLGMTPDNIFFEKGGVFKDVNSKSGGMVPSLRTEAKKDVQERIAAIINYAEKNVITNLKHSEKSVDKNEDLNTFSNFTNGNIRLNNLPLLYGNENNPLKLTNTISSENIKKDEDLLPPDVVTKKDKLPIENSIESGLFIQRNYSDHQFSDRNSTVNNSTIKKTQIVQTKVPRVKRSKEYGYYENPVFRDTETSPLYKRVNFLRQILNKMHQSKLLEHAEQDQHYQDFPGTTDTLRSNNQENKLQMSEKYADHTVKIPSRRKNDLNKEYPRLNKERENINYLPGEFYEILGGLKIDSNVSLKEKEEILEASDSLHKQSVSPQCNDKISKLTVTKKPKNMLQEDRRLVEHATENLKQYYLLKNHTVQQQVKTEKPDDSIEEKMGNYQDKFLQTMSKEGKSENDKQTKQDLDKFFQDPEKVKSNNETILIELPVKRTKREINYLKGENDFYEPPQLTKQNKENYKKSDYSDEVELRRFLEELTSEGEQLLQTIDKEYGTDIESLTHRTDNKQTLSPGYVSNLDKNKTFFSDEKRILKNNKTEEPDFYIKNNILIDKKMKPKRKYPSIGEQIMEYSFLNRTTNMDKNIETRNQLNTTLSPVVDVSSTYGTNFPQPSEPTEPTELTTLENSSGTSIKANSTNGSITEAINNSDMFLESVIPQAGKTTKPGVHFTNNPGLILETNNTSSNLQYDPTENSNIEYVNSSKVSKTNAENYETHKVIQSNNSTEETIDQHKKTSGVGDSILIKTSSNLIPATEKSTDKEDKLDVRNTNIPNILQYGVPNASQFKPNSNENLEVTRNVKDNNYEGTAEMNQQHKKPLTLLNFSNTTNKSAETSPYKERKLDIESKNENSILPPPLKSILFQKLQPISVPPVLTLNRNLSFPRKIDFINNKITEFNSKHKLTAPVLEKSSLLNTTFSDKYKERLEAIRQRLQKARERLLHLSIPRVTRSIMSHKPQMVKREINLNRENLNILFNEKKKNQVDKQSEESYSNTKNTMGLLKHLQGSLIKYPNTFDHVPRFARQIYNGDIKKRSSSMENDRDQSGSAETTEDFERQPSGNIIIPYYFSEIKKWVIPLSNSTENILYNNKLFPVNLYGIVSDKWVQENIGGSSNIESRRQRRALQYPCVKDKFNDFEAEDESSKLPWSSTVEHGKTSSARSIKENQALSLTGQKQTVPLSQIYSIRSKRAINQDIQRNEMEMKALLTNEIIKERPANDISNNENVFSSMLHKTLARTVTNKTGIERMFELAKQYQETNPSSLEIFSIKNKRYENKKLSKDFLENSEEEKKAIEVMGDKNHNRSSRKNQMMTTDVTPTNHSVEQAEVRNITAVEQAIVRNITTVEQAIVRNITTVETPYSDHEQNTHTSPKDRKTHQDAWSDFINKIQEFFDSITVVIKRAIK